MKFKDPWGWSKLDVFHQCPRKFHYQFMKKLPTGSSPAMERGAKLHEVCECYVRGWVNELPEELIFWKDALDRLRAIGAAPEQSWGFDKDWNLLKDWFQPSTWLRAKSDTYYEDPTDGLVVVDYKSGKYKIPPDGQKKLYALCAYHARGKPKFVTAEYWFLDQNTTHSVVYTEAELLVFQEEFEQDAAQLYAEEQWQTAPSMECRWCPFSRSKGGPCEY